MKLNKIEKAIRRITIAKGRANRYCIRARGEEPSENTVMTENFMTRSMLEGAILKGIFLKREPRIEYIKKREKFQIAEFNMKSDMNVSFSLPDNMAIRVIDKVSDNTNKLCISVSPYKVDHENKINMYEISIGLFIATVIHHLCPLPKDTDHCEFVEKCTDENDGETYDRDLGLDSVYNFNNSLLIYEGSVKAADCLKKRITLYTNL